MHYSGLGDIYSNANAMKAYEAGKLASRSLKSSKRFRLIFCNETSKPLILCWVGFDNKLHHYYKLQPSKRTTIIGGLESFDYPDTFMDTRIEGGLHKENSFLGHSFVLGIPPRDVINRASEARKSKDNGYYYYEEEEDDSDSISCWMPSNRKKRKCDLRVDKSRIQTIVGAYRPMHLGSSSEEEKEIKAELCVHVIKITEELAFLPNAKIKSMPQIVFRLSVERCEIDDEPLDTSGKEYEDMHLGGWTVKCEKDIIKDIFTNGAKESKLKKFTKKLESDLVAAKNKLPSHAYKLLKSTPFWINKAQMYGPKAAPVRGRGMCFHPGKEWLVRNGMSEEKCGGIELYDVNHYLENCNLWHGQGGVLIHELSHAL